MDDELRRNQYNYFLEKDTHYFEEISTPEVIRLMQKYPDQLDYVWYRILANSLEIDLNFRQLMAAVPNFDINMVGNFHGYGHTVLECAMYFNLSLMEQLLQLGANPNTPGMLHQLVEMSDDPEYRENFFDLYSRLQRFGFRPKLTVDVWLDIIRDPDDSRYPIILEIDVDWFNFAEHLNYQPFMESLLKELLSRHPPPRGLRFTLSRKIPFLMSETTLVELAYQAARRYGRRDPDARKILGEYDFPGI